MAQKARPLTAEESDSLEKLGQAREEGKTIPAPEMVLFTGETALKVRELAEMCGIDSQEVIGVALQKLYEEVHARAKEEREADDRQTRSQAKQAAGADEGSDPFRPF